TAGASTASGPNNPRLHQRRHPTRRTSLRKVKNRKRPNHSREERSSKSGLPTLRRQTTRSDLAIDILPTETRDKLKGDLRRDSLSHFRAEAKAAERSQP